MAKYIIKGFYNKRGNVSKFSKEIEADSEKLAKEKIFADLGSKHKVKRRFITLEEIKNA